MTTSWAPTLTPAAGDDHVRPGHGLGEASLDLGQVVARDAQAADLGADQARLGRDGRRVAVVDLAGAERRAGLDQLVAGGQDRDARPTVDAHGAMPGGDDDGHRGRRDANARFEQAVALAEVAAGEADVGTRGRRRMDGDGLGQVRHAGGSVGLLDRDDGVGAGRDHGPGQDADGGPGPDLRLRRVARARLPDHAQGLRPAPGGPDHVRRLHREAIHGAVVPGRHRHVGDDRLRQDPPHGLVEADGRRRQRLESVEHPFQGGLEREQAAHVVSAVARRRA